MSTLPCLCHELHGCLEEVLIESPFIPIEVIEEIDVSFGLVAVVPDELPDVRPVLLLHMGIVILLARSSPGESDACIVAEPEEVPIDEFPAIIRINALPREGTPSIDRGEGENDPLLCFPKERFLLRPPRGKVGIDKGMRKEALGITPIVCDTIELTVAEIMCIPPREGDRNVPPEESPWFR
jgi:hypothetical protein